MTQTIPIVYMCAGMSSRFGGKIKQFAQVGAHGETLIEVSMRQAQKAGFNKIVFIVGEKTEGPFREKFGVNYKGTPIAYAKQSFDPATRDKPWGTVDALVSVMSVVHENFAVCNGDDLYGLEAFTQAATFVKQQNTQAAAIGYLLGKVVPESGKTNRGIFTTDAHGYVTTLIETFNIEKNNLHASGLTEHSLCSMNLFCLPKEVLLQLQQRLIEFKNTHAGDRKAECLLPVELGNLINQQKLRMKLIPTTAQWMGITNPEDEEVVRAQLAREQ